MYLSAWFHCNRSLGSTPHAFLSPLITQNWTSSISTGVGLRMAEGAALFLVRTLGFHQDSHLAVTPCYQCLKEQKERAKSKKFCKEQNSSRETPVCNSPKMYPDCPCKCCLLHLKPRQQTFKSQCA